jgi:hypothetical protein
MVYIFLAAGADVRLRTSSVKCGPGNAIDAALKGNHSSIIDRIRIVYAQDDVQGDSGVEEEVRTMLSPRNEPANVYDAHESPRNPGVEDSIINEEILVLNKCNDEISEDSDDRDNSSRVGSHIFPELVH